MIVNIEIKYIDIASVVRNAAFKDGSSVPAGIGGELAKVFVNGFIRSFPDKAEKIFTSLISGYLESNKIPAKVGKVSIETNGNTVSKISAVITEVDYIGLAMLLKPLLIKNVKPHISKIFEILDGYDDTILYNALTLIDDGKKEEILSILAEEYNFKICEKINLYLAENMLDIQIGSVSIQSLPELDPNIM